MQPIPRSEARLESSAASLFSRDLDIPWKFCCLFVLRTAWVCELLTKWFGRRCLQDSIPDFRSIGDVDWWLNCNASVTVQQAASGQYQVLARSVKSGLCNELFRYGKPKTVARVELLQRSTHVYLLYFVTKRQNRYSGRNFSAGEVPELKKGRIAERTVHQTSL